LTLGIFKQPSDQSDEGPGRRNLKLSSEEGNEHFDPHYAHVLQELTI
jgi:hypothetical protein